MSTASYPPAPAALSDLTELSLPPQTCALCQSPILPSQPLDFRPCCLQTLHQSCSDAFFAYQQSAGILDPPCPICKATATSLSASSTPPRLDERKETAAGRPAAVTVARPIVTSTSSVSALAIQPPKWSSWFQPPKILSSILPASATPTSGSSTPAFSLSISTSPSESGGVSVEASPRSGLSNGSMDDLFSKFDDILAAELDGNTNTAEAEAPLQSAEDGGGGQGQVRQESRDFDIGDVMASSDYQQAWQEQKGRDDELQLTTQPLPPTAEESAQAAVDESLLQSFNDFPVDHSIVSDPFPSTDLDTAFDSILAGNTSLDGSSSATPSTAAPAAVSPLVRSPPSGTPLTVTPPQLTSPRTAAVNRSMPRSTLASTVASQSNTPPTLQPQQPTIVSPIIAATPAAQPPTFSSSTPLPSTAVFTTQFPPAVESIDPSTQLQAVVAERDGQLAVLQSDLNTWVERYGQIYTEYERLSAHVANLASAQPPEQSASTATDTAHVTELYERVVSLTAELEDERTARECERSELRQRQHSLMEALDSERNENRQQLERIQAESQQRTAEAERRRVEAEAEVQRLTSVVAKSKEAVEKERRDARQREEDEMRRVVEDRERVLGEREELVQRVDTLVHQLSLSVRRDDYDALEALRGKEREELIAHYNTVLEQQAEQINSLATLTTQPQSQPDNGQLAQLQQRIAELEEVQTRTAAERAEDESSRREAEVRASQFEDIINQQTGELETLRSSQHIIQQLQATIQQLQSQLSAVPVAAGSSAAEKALREELEEIGWKVSALEEERDSWAEERQEMEARIRAMHTEVKQVKAASNSSTPATSSPSNRDRNEREEKEQLLAAREAELGSLKQQLGELQSKLELWESNVDELQAELEEAEQQRREMRADFDSREQQLREQLNEAQQQLIQRTLVLPLAASEPPPHSEEGWPSFDDSNAHQTELVAELEAKVAALVDELQQARAAAEHDVSQWRKQLAELRETMQRRDEQYKAELMASEEHLRASQQHDGALQSELQRLSEAFSREKVEADVLRQSLREVAAELAGAQETNRALREEERRIAEVSAQLSEKEEQLADLIHQQEEKDEDRRREREDMLALISRERQQLTEQLEVEREERRAERADMENVAEERARLQDEREQLMLKAQSSQQQLEALQYQYAQLQADMQQREAQVGNMQSQFSASMEEREARLSQQISALSLERDQLTQHYQTLAAERDQLAQQLANSAATQPSADGMGEEERVKWKHEVDVRDEKLKKLVKVARELKANVEALAKEKVVRDDESKVRDEEWSGMEERLAEMQREKKAWEGEREEREQAEREKLATEVERDEQEQQRLNERQQLVEQLSAQVQQLQHQLQQGNTTQQQVEEQLTRLQQQHESELQERDARVSQLSAQVIQLLDAEADLQRVLRESQDESEEAQRSLLLKEDELNEQAERFDSERAALQQQLSDAIAMRQLMEQAQTEVSATLQQVQQLQSELQQQRDALNAANQQASAAAQELAAERQRTEDVRLQHEQQLAELLHDKEAAQTRLQQLLATHTAEMQALQAEMEALRTAQHRQASEKEEEGSRIDELMNQMSEKEDQLFELKGRLEEVQAELDRVTGENERVREEAEQKLSEEKRRRTEAEVEEERKREEAGERVLQLQAKVDELARQLEEERQLEQDRAREREEEDANRALGAAISPPLDFAPPASAEAEAKVSELEADLAHVKDELARQEIRLGEMLEQLDSKEDEVGALKRESEELSDLLERERNALSEKEEDELRERATRLEEEEAQRATYVAEMKQLRERIASLTEQQDADKRQLVELREAEKRGNDRDARLTEVEEARVRAETQLREMQQQAEAADSELRQLRDNIDSLQRTRVTTLDAARTETSENERALQSSVTALEARVRELAEEREVSQRHAQSYRDEVTNLKHQIHELNSRLLRREEDQKGGPERQPAASDKQTEEKLPTPSLPDSTAQAAAVEDDEADGWNNDGWDDELSVDDGAPAALATSAASLPAASTRAAPAAASYSSPVDREKLELLEARVTELEEEAETAREDATKVYEQLKQAEAEVARLKGERRAAAMAVSGGAGNEEEVEELRHRISEMEEEIRSLLVSGDEEKGTLEAELVALKVVHSTAINTIAHITHSSDTDIVAQVKTIADKVAEMERQREEREAVRRKEDEDEREALRSQVREWTDKYDGVLRVQEALQQDGEETERENRKLAQEIFELKEKIGLLEEDREKELAALQQLGEQQQLRQTVSQPAGAVERVEEQTQTEPSSPMQHAEPVAPVATSVDSYATTSDVAAAEAEPAVEAVSMADTDASPANVAAPATEQGSEAATAAPTAAYSEEYVRTLYEQSMRDREQLIAYYSDFLTRRDAELQQLREQLAATQSRMPAAPLTLQLSDTHFDNVISSAERDTTHLSSTGVEQQDIVEPSSGHTRAADSEEHKLEHREREEGASEQTHPMASPGVPPAFLDDLPIGSPPSASFSLNANGDVEQTMDGDALTFTLQPVTPLSPLSTALSPASRHSAADSRPSEPSQSSPDTDIAPSSSDASSTVASGVVTSSEVDTGATDNGGNMVPVDAVAQWQAAVAERDAQLAAMYGDLNAWVERYGAIYTAYDQLTAQVAALTAAQQTQPAAAAVPTAAHMNAPKDEAQTAPEIPSLVASDTPAALQEAAADAELTSPSHTQHKPAALTVLSPAPDQAVEMEQLRQQLYEVEHERSRLREEKDDLLYRMEELKDKQAQLEQHNQQLVQQQQSSDSQNDASSSHLLHLSLLQQEMKTVQAAVDERDRFITLTLARIAAYQKDREDNKRKEEQRKLKEKEQQVKQGGGFKLFGGSKKQTELRPEDDDTMEWNGREWVKKPDEDAVSTLLPLPTKPKPLPPSALPGDLTSLSVDEVVKQMGLKTTAGSPATAGMFSVRSPPAGSSMLGRPSNAYAAAKPKSVSARYASSFDDFGFEGDGKAALPAMSPSISAVLSPLPPDADLNAQVFTPFVPVPAAPLTMPSTAGTSTDSSLSSLSQSDDARLHGRTVHQLLDALDAANASILSLEQQLAITSSLPRPIPSPSPDQPVVDGMEMAHLRGQLRVREEEKVALEMALALEREHAAALDRKIEQMRQMEAGLIDGKDDDEHDDPAMDAGGDESGMDAAQLLPRVRALRHKHDRVSRQLHMARQHIRELEVDRERHSHGSVEEQEERVKREAAMASLQREFEALLRERDGLRGERDHLLHQLQQAIAAATHTATTPSSTDTTMVRRSAGGSDDDKLEVQRLRAMVSELQRHIGTQQPDSSVGAATDGVGVSSAGSVMTATVRINRFFLVSFVLLLVAVLGLQLAKPEWMGLDLMSGSSGGAGGSGGMWEASREL